MDEGSGEESSGEEEMLLNISRILVSPEPIMDDDGSGSGEFCKLCFFEFPFKCCLTVNPADNLLIIFNDIETDYYLIIFGQKYAKLKTKNIILFI